MLDLASWTSAIHEWMLGLMPEWAAILVECVLVALVIITLYAVFAIALIYMERKVCAFFQCRLGRELNSCNTNRGYKALQLAFFPSSLFYPYLLFLWVLYVFLYSFIALFSSSIYS